MGDLEEWVADGDVALDGHRHHRVDRTCPEWLERELEDWYERSSMKQNGVFLFT